MMRLMKRLALTVGAVLVSGQAMAGTLWPLTPDCEEALALSAAPAYLREDAGVYVLGAEGYEIVREGTNGYQCLIQRNSDESLIPQCFDKVGQRAHVVVHLDEGRKMRSGVPWPQIMKERNEGFEKGTYKVADGHGVVYMASDYNFIVSPNGRIRRLIHPHVMYHAPYVSHEDIGSIQQESFKNRGMPMIGGEGPLGFMIGFVEKATDTSDVENTCKGQLPKRETFAPFPEWGE